MKLSDELNLIGCVTVYTDTVLEGWKCWDIQFLTSLSKKHLLKAQSHQSQFNGCVRIIPDKYLGGYQ